MNFSDVKSVTIPEGVVTEIKQGDTVLWKAKRKRLPDAYQEVEWIKPLNAKLSLPANTMDYGYASFKVSFPNKETFGYTLAAGGTSTTLITKFEVSTITLNNILNVKFDIINSELEGLPDTYSAWDAFDPSNAFVARWDGDNLYIGSKTTPTSPDFQKDNWYLFGNYKKTYNYEGELTVYEVSMGQYTFVPCYRKSDNVIGMGVIGRTSAASFYTFLTSDEGSFEKGNDV